MMYTVINKGEWISIMVGSKVCKVFIMAMLPRNKCVIKNSNFDLIISDRFASSVKVGKKEPSQDPPLFEALPITLLAKERPIELRKSEAYTPWEHRVQPLRLREEGIDLLPWDKEEIVRNEITTQTLPDIISPHPQKNSKPRKILTLAFPQIHVPDRRPLTTLDIDIMYKSVSNSPNAQKSLNNRHKNSMF